MRWHRAALAAATLLALAGCGAAGEPGAKAEAAASWNVVREEAWIPMRDGVRLRATLLAPQGEGPFPCIVYRTPYSRQEYEGWSEFPPTAARHGYLVALVDVRGRHDSEGAFHAYRNWSRTHDAAGALGRAAPRPSRHQTDR